MNEWTIEELRTAVAAYVMMLGAHKNGRKINKAGIYRSLAMQSDRSAKSWEYRMQNISHVLAKREQEWLPGLKPAGNVGRRVIAMIEQCLDENKALTRTAEKSELWAALEQLSQSREAHT